MKYFSLFGKPKLIVSDQERACTTIELKEYLKSNNINIHFTYVNSSNSNSTIERFHSTLLEHIRLIINNETIITRALYSANLALYKALHAYNNSINSITKLTPFELFFGRKINESMEADIEVIREKRLQLQAYNNSYNKKKTYIDQINKSRNEPENLPEEVFIKTKPNTKTQSRNKQITIQRQKQLNIDDYKDIKYHKNNVNKPRTTSFQGITSMSSEPGPRNTGHNNKPRTSDGTN